MPTRLAARKCPSSCTKTSTPSTNANDTTVITVFKTESSDLQFYPARHLASIVARPCVHRAYFGQRRHLGRDVRVHRALDHQGDRGETEVPVEKARDRYFVRPVEHDRQAPFGVERAICEPQARKGVGVRRVEGA